MSRKKTDPQFEADVIRLFDRGMTVNSIVKNLGASRTTVRRVLIRRVLLKAPHGNK